MMRKMKARPGFAGWVPIPVIAAALLLGAAVQSATADTCMADRYLAATGGRLQCTANDVKIARVTNISVPNTNPPVPLTSCIAGQTVTFAADFEVALNATARYDIGLYLATDGDPNGDGALSSVPVGGCAASTITPANAQNFLNLDTATPTDTCGDIDAGHNPQVVHMIVTTKCVAGTNTTKLALPNCTSWRQPGSNQVCTSAADAYPGSPSKCNCDKNFTIDVTVESPTLTVVKTASPTQLNEPGGTVAYTVTVTNNASVVPVTLTTIVDDPDNNPATSNSVSYNAADICQATVLAPGASTNCTFTLPVSGNAGQTFTDNACVTAVDANGKQVGPSCNTTSVSIKDIVPTAAVTKTLEGVKCAVVTFGVKVENTDPAEPLTLTALNDVPYGAITSVHNDVLATTCSVPQTIGVKDPAVPGSGQYTCTFDANVCTASQTAVKTVSHTDTVTGTLNDNDNNTFTQGSNNLTVTVTAQ